MSLSLAQYAYIVGGAFVLLHLLVLAKPGAARAAVLAFPRSIWPGRFLVILNCAWVVWIVSHAELGRFSFLHPYVYVAAPIVALLVIALLDDLLSPRMLGGLLLLIGNPILIAARWHDSPLRLVLTVLVYIWAVEGMVLMLSPYRFRKTALYWTANDLRWRGLGVGGVALGCILILLGLFVYR